MYRFIASVLGILIVLGVLAHSPIAKREWQVTMEAVSNLERRLREGCGGNEQCLRNLGLRPKED